MTTKKVSILQKFAISVSGSMLSKIMLGYADSFGNVSSTNYIFGGNYFETISKSTTQINDTYVYGIVKKARNLNPAWATPVTQSLYLFVFNGSLKYFSKVSNGEWSTSTGWCGFHSNDLRIGKSVFSNKDIIIFPIGGNLLPSYMLLI